MRSVTTVSRCCTDKVAKGWFPWPHASLPAAVLLGLGVVLAMGLVVLLGRGLSR